MTLASSFWTMLSKILARIDRSNDGLSSFAAAPVENESAITVPGGSIGYNELLATH